MAMNVTAAFVLPLLIGVIAGLRAMTAPTAVSLAARAGWLDLSATPLAFLGYAYTPWIFTVLALGELVTDQLPTTPSRTVPIQFGTRILMGGLTGGAAALGSTRGEQVDYSLFGPDDAGKAPMVSIDGEWRLYEIRK